MLKRRSDTWTLITDELAGEDSCHGVPSESEAAVCLSDDEDDDDEDLLSCVTTGMIDSLIG